MVRWGVGILALALASCGAGTATIQSRFDPADAAFALKGGTGRIEGQAFLRRNFGILVTAAGERVFLIPATPYARERFTGLFGGDKRAYYGNTVDDPPPDYYESRRETKVDMSGRFVFEDVAPGSYIVATRVFWTEPKSFLTRGGAIYDIVEAKNDRTAFVIVSGK